jgi:nucleotide-binding universal stress UspA family protein
MDWSPSSLRAVEYMKVLKDVVEEINLVNVVGEEDLNGASATAIPKLRKEARNKLEKICEGFELAGIKAKGHVHVGDPDEEIEKAAKDCQATLIALGSSTKSAWVEKWLGSTPQKIAEESIYPTLIVPPERDPSAETD